MGPTGRLGVECNRKGLGILASFDILRTFLIQNAHSFPTLGFRNSTCSILLHTFLIQNGHLFLPVRHQ